MPDIKKVKIVATLGRNDGQDLILKLASRGVDVFRNNMSHASREELMKRVRAIRLAEKREKRPIAVLGDLMGPKIRIGNVQPGSVVSVGDNVAFVRKPVWGTSKVLSLNYATILKNVRPGAEIYLGDGAVKLEVTTVWKDEVHARVIVGGELRSRMGFSCHGLAIPKSLLSAKDKKDIQTLLSIKADIIAMSFVQTAKDIESVLKLLPKKNRPLLIAKIETRGAVENAEAILDLADGLMIARGDLGFSVPMPEIPFIQKDLIRLCLRKAKPVITATQMLESMVASHMPTRAEVADVTKAILDGTDAVMLSGETALGKFPEEAVKMMASIIRTATGSVAERDFPDDDGITEAVGASVVRVANQTKSKLIVVLTESGATARRIARHRPKQPILALTTSGDTVRELALTWGVHPVRVAKAKHFEDAVALSRKAAAHNPLLSLKKGEPFIISAGVPFGKAGSTNLLLVQKI